jgi:hypothetical protein
MQITLIRRAFSRKILVEVMLVGKRAYLTLYVSTVAEVSE